MTTKKQPRWVRAEMADRKQFGGDLLAVAELPDGVRLMTWLDWLDGPKVCIGVLEPRPDTVAPGRIRTSDHSAWWPDIAPFWDRGDWPREVYAGSGWEDAGHDAPADLRKLLDRAIAKLELDYQD